MLAKVGFDNNLVVYLSFIDSGAMFHYVQQLALAVHKTRTSALVVFSNSAVGLNTGHPGEILILPKAQNKWQHKFREKYNPLYYHDKAQTLVTKLKPQIVHVTSDYVGLLSFVKKLSALGPKIVYTVHDPLPHEENVTLWGKIFSKYKIKYQRPYVLKYCSAVHIHSSKHLDKLVSMYGEWVKNKAYIVQHGGGQLPEIRKGNTEPPEIRGEKLHDEMVILFFGRIHPYKGLDYLFKAFQICLDKKIKAKLIIAGEGKFDIESARHFGNDCIIINRYIDEQEIKRLFEISSFVVLPYVSATQSGVIPLAYSFEKPVIITDTGALSELVVDRITGLLVPPKDEVALAEAIISMLDDKKLVQMSKEAKSFMEKHFSWDKVAKKHLKKYRELCRL